MNALILAAGLGTRLGVLTAECPKALVQVAGRTMLDNQLHWLGHFGFDHIVINVHHFADKITDYLKPLIHTGMTIEISDESEMLLDTGGGIRKALHLFGNDNPVLIHNVDIFSTTNLASLYNTHLRSGADATLLTSPRKTSRQLYFDSDMRLKGWSDSRTGATRSPFSDFDTTVCTPLAFQGIHIVSRSILPLLDKCEAYKFSITDFYIDNASRLKFNAVREDSAHWVDAGKPESLARAAEIVALRVQKERPFL